MTALVSRPLSPTRGATALAGAELRLLVRNRLLAFTALVMPLFLGVFLGLNPAVLGAEGTPALQIVAVLAIAVYAGATTSLTARRQDLYLKRLRSGELTDTTVLVGLLAPLFVLGVAQAVVLAAAVVLLGGPAPTGPAVVALGVVGGSALCCAAAVATSGLTRRPETAQITTLPLFLALLVAAFLVLTRPATEVSAQILAVPGAGVAQLIRLGWAAPDTGAVLAALAATAVWTGIAVLVAASTFRWDPRS